MISSGEAHHLYRFITFAFLSELGNVQCITCCNSSLYLNMSHAGVLKLPEAFLCQMSSYMTPEHHDKAPRRQEATLRLISMGKQIQKCLYSILCKHFLYASMFLYWSMLLRKSLFFCLIPSVSSHLLMTHCLYFVLKWVKHTNSKQNGATNARCNCYLYLFLRHIFSSAVFLLFELFKLICP